MLKIGWGSRIAILYIGFVLLIGIMVTMCMNQHIDLVSDDYYEKELVFQNKINEMNNANMLSEKVSHIISNNFLAIRFPSVLNGKEIKGSVFFFRPSDAKKDFKSELSVNKNGVQQFMLDKFSKGMYKMQLSWKIGNVPYFAEEIIVIP
jgi:hypothetical protein